jgi:membrane protein DedA with SNARE-associated domain
VLSDLTERLTDLVDAVGYVGVAVLVAVESIFPPIPSEAVLPFAGFVASDGDANLVGMILAATVGSMVGAYALYAFAAWIGQERLHYAVARWGRWVRLSVADVERSEAWFARRGSVAVLVGRCVPVVRALISFPAGFGRMPLGTFSLYTFLGSLIWNTAQIGTGYLLRDQWDEVTPIMDRFQLLILAVLVLIVLAYVWAKFLSPAARRGETTERRRDAEVIAAWHQSHPRTTSETET